MVLYLEGEWDALYPTKDDFIEDIQKGTLFVAMDNGQLVAIYVISRECDEEYLRCAWENETDGACVLHRFCVSPNFQNRGIGKSILRHMEEQMRTMGFQSVRLDVFTENPYALKLYEKNSYEKRGYADWRKGRFLLMEKKL